MNSNLTSENVIGNLLKFSVPYLISCFLQSFYGLVDLFVVGRFCGADVISAVSCGSQVMHMVTVVCIGLSMGSAVLVGRYVGARDESGIGRTVGNTFSIFLLVAVILTAVLIVCTVPILQVLSVPSEAFSYARSYLLVCFSGTPVIVVVNSVSAVYRGFGDSRHPMCFVALSGVVNIVLDVLFVGVFEMSSSGAAFATVIAQGVSAFMMLMYLFKGNIRLKLSRSDLRPDSNIVRSIFLVGAPIALQDGFVQVAFLTITFIANMRGVDTAAAVGIVEKIISFLFLVPSAMLSSVSAITAQNLGAGNPQNGKRALGYGIIISLIYGAIISIIFQFISPFVIGLFTGDEIVVELGTQYIVTYVMDCFFAGIHFCFSGYFTAVGKSWVSFLHNICSIILIRIPGAYFAGIWFPDTLSPMGISAPAGSLLSSAICIAAYYTFAKREKKTC